MILIYFPHKPFIPLLTKLMFFNYYSVIRWETYRAVFCFDVAKLLTMRVVFAKMKMRNNLRVRARQFKFSLQS